MNSKEVVIGAIILIILFGGFAVSTRRKEVREIREEEASQESQLTIEDIEMKDSIQNRNNVQGTSQVNEPPKQEAPKEDPLANPNKITPPEMELLVGINYKAKMTTSMGVVMIDLLEKLTPITVNNFVYLSKLGFYDGLIFHRVIENFMVQGGDPNGNGTGGPGYAFVDEITSKKMLKGSVAMANAGPNTNGSQFFIVTAGSTPWLDGKHTIFGMVEEGMDIVMGMSRVDTNSADKPLEDIVIKKVEIIEEPY